MVTKRLAIDSIPKDRLNPLKADLLAILDDRLQVVEKRTHFAACEGVWFVDHPQACVSRLAQTGRCGVRGLRFILVCLCSLPAGSV